MSIIKVRRGWETGLAGRVPILLRGGAGEPTTPKFECLPGRSTCLARAGEGVVQLGG